MKSSPVFFVILQVCLVVPKCTSRICDTSVCGDSGKEFAKQPSHQQQHAEKDTITGDQTGSKPEGAAGTSTAARGYCSCSMDDVCTASTTDKDCSMKCEQRPAASNSLVLYNPTFLQPFRLSSRTFNFANRDFTIRQNWADFGVAAVVWDSALVLCEYLESQCKTGDLILQGKRVIELGAGTGLVGMVATALNGEVTVTDRDDALDPLKENVKLNFPPSPERTTSSSSSPSSLNASSGPAVRALTWGKNLEEFSATYDLILGADIVYMEDTFPDLLRTFLHLSREESLILFSCRIRYERDKRFLQMVRKNFRLVEVLQDEARGIVIYSAQKLSV
ncbi:protein N-lysine methyltransferase METTL21A-like [Diadema setosum]|uniref:protein N-lysine methyltransferase METTL21A-like n=1 Tax=Diadema setosum TaxID=31175 RepID=UPI003B3AABB5